MANHGPYQNAVWTTDDPNWNNLNTVTMTGSTMAIAPNYFPAQQPYRPMPFQGPQFAVQRAENGFILAFSDSPGGMIKYYMAKDAEELSKLVVAAMVEAKMEK